MLKNTFTLFSFLLVINIIYSQSTKIDFEEYELKNGLKVLLHENHRTPIVAVSVMYHVCA